MVEAVPREMPSLNFNGSLADASQYPKNLVRPRFYADSLKAYSDRLTNRDEKLFLDEQLANVGFWESDESSNTTAVGIQGFKPSTAKSLSELTTQLGSPPPQCRFIFIHMKDSRSPLYISRRMLTYVLTYLQAMPEFLDFLFPFGRQIYKEDFQFGGFRHETRLEKPTVALPASLQRSGKDLQVCYSLKSVEFSKHQLGCQWVIRQTSMYHAFDFGTGSTSWVCVKARARNVIRRRVEETTTGLDAGSFDSATRSFASALKVHLILVDWAEENWRWYINYLEERLQVYSGLISTAMENSMPPAASDSMPISSAVPSQPPLRRQFTRLLQSGYQRARSFPVRRRTMQRTNTHQIPLTNVASPAPQYEKPPPADDVEFQFQDVQGVQLIEERCYEAQLVLKSNVETISAMKQYYQNLVSTLRQMDDCPLDIQGIKTDVSRFETRVVEVINSVKIQMSRIESLLLVLANRKTLMLGILEHRNIEANKDLAEKSRESAERMERMTEQMNEVAIKTRKDTVSMKVITVVTLFFLPGTFISTLMSTDIVHFNGAGLDRPHMSFSPAALKLFLIVCLPLMLATFIAWGVMYHWSTRYGGGAGHDQKKRNSAANGTV